MSTPYNQDFYDWQREESVRSARALTPLLVEWLRPTSVVDVGCGTGTWLREFIHQGVAEVHGLDGDYVDRQRLLIPSNSFTVIDLIQPAPLKRRYDLALSLEVGEHLPETSADNFVRLLTEASDRVVFSAAIPEQGGTAHINEQWLSWWAERFAARGFRLIQEFRWLVWPVPGLAPYYAQNINLFVSSAAADKVRELILRLDPAPPLDVVHPGCWTRAHHARPLTLRENLSDLPRSFWSALRWRLRSWARGS